ncbi:MAG: hypothetical protein ACMUJM_25250 [bacterium]
MRQEKKKSEELEVLEIVTGRLNKEDIPYIVSGSIALNYYTIPRMTRDIDIVIELDYMAINKFVNLFQSDFYIDPEMIEREVFRQGMFNLIHNQYVIKIDFIIRKKTKFQDLIFLRKKNVTIGDSKIWLISAEDLILAKLLWAKDSHSDIQLKDIKNLFTTVPQLEEEYIVHWVSQLGLEEIYKLVNNG